METVESIIASDEPTAVLPAVDAQHDPLRLRFCPQCDYAFETLPAVGRCPECGREYDQSFVVVRGTPGALTVQSLLAGKFSGRSLIIGTMMPLLIVACMMSRNPGRFGLYFGAMVAIVFGIGLLEWMNSPRPGQVLVWMSAQGVGQQNDFDPQSLTAKLRRIVPFLVISLYMVYRQQGSIGWIIFGLVSMWLVLNWMRIRKQRIDRREIACRANGFQPDMLDWRFMRPEVQTLSAGQYRLRVQRPSVRGWLKNYPVDIRLEATPEFIEHLEAQMKVWQTERERADQIQEQELTAT